MVYDYNTNLYSKEFKSILRLVGTIPKLVLVKVYYSIRKVERYYRLLRCAYKIITKEHPELSDKNRL